MTKTALALLVGLLLAAPAMAVETGGTWYADFDKAAEAAKAEGKDLLVDFTGSDWCGWCVKLHNEVFSHDEFLTGVKDKYVLVKLDFPRGPEAKAKVPNPTRNDELQKKYGIRGYPTILLMTPDGEVYAKTGYQQGGAANYVKHLNEIAETGKKSIVAAKEIVKAYEAAADDAKAAGIEKAIEALAAEKPGTPASMILTPVVKAGMDLDPKNESGLKLKAVEALMNNGSGEPAVLEAAIELDSKNEKGLLEHAILSKFMQTRPDPNDMGPLKKLLADVESFEKLGVVKDKNIGIQLFANTAWCFHKFLNDNTKAKHFADKLVAIGGVEANPRLQGLVDMINKAVEAEKKPEAPEAPEAPEKPDR